jgi:hypothetical protein
MQDAQIQLRGAASSDGIVEYHDPYGSINFLIVPSYPVTVISKEMLALQVISFKTCYMPMTIS